MIVVDLSHVRKSYPTNLSLYNESVFSDKPVARDCFIPVAVITASIKTLIVMFPVVASLSV